jgi:hypothetical protein
MNENTQSNELLSNFNPNAKIKHGEFISLINKLEPLKDVIYPEKKAENESDKDKKIDIEMMKYGEKIQEKIQENQQKIKEKLVCTFFDLSHEQVGELEVEEFQSAYKKIVENRPSLVFFLYLPKLEKEAITQLENTSNSSTI